MMMIHGANNLKIRLRMFDNGAGWTIWSEKGQSDRRMKRSA
jgi:hypothetical protein